MISVREIGEGETAAERGFVRGVGREKSDEGNAHSEDTVRRHGGSGGRDRARGEWDTGPGDDAQRMED